MITLDFETYSECDLKKCGPWMYSIHPSTEIICAAFWDSSNDHAMVDLWLPGDDPPTPHDVVDIYFEAHNSFFEYCIWNNVGVPKYGFPEIPINRFRCSAAKASYFALPRKLGEAGKALGLSTVKDEEGRRVMLQLSKPKKPSKKSPSTRYTFAEHPDKFDKLYEYCKDDVLAEEALSNYLRDLPVKEQQIWALDQKINLRGVPADREAAEAALYIIEELKKDYDKRLLTLTNGIVESATKLKQLKTWLNYRGVNTETLRADDVERMLKEDHPADVMEALEIRAAIGKASTAKYKAFLNYLAPEGRMRGMLMYHGASTGRWSGKGPQLHNLPRTGKDTATLIDIIKTGDIDLLKAITDKPMDFISEAIRGVITAPPGKDLICADFSAIEARVLLWLSNDPGLEVFRKGEDIYKDMAASIYRKPISEITKDERQLGKVAILGLGYGMGHKKFIETAGGYGITIDIKESKKIVDIYRDKFFDVKKYWYATENAAIQAVKTRNIIKSGKVFWGTSGDFLHCKLPSGRSLSFYKPVVKHEKTKIGYKDTLSFMGTNSVTRQWERQYTYGGKLVENISQGVARDFMAEGMIRAEDAGYDIILTVHDEVLSEIPEGFGSLKEFEDLISVIPKWGSGCPITAEGWRGKNYRK